MTTRTTRKRAPQHRLDHRPKYVPLDDPALDQDLVAAVLLDKRDQVERPDGELLDLVPLRRYLSGQTRYDLEEPALRECLAKTGALDLDQAEVWELRVLPFDQRLRCIQTAETDERRANLLAFAHGVVGLRLPTTDAASLRLIKVIEGLPAKDRTKAQIQDLYEATADYRFNAIDDVGEAVRLLSSDLSEEERKN
jgi:hypothetical protein